MMPTYDDIATVLQPAGLIPRGGFRPAAADGVPPLHRGCPTQAVVLVGNAGPAMWRVFAASLEHGDGRRHPLDRWSERVVTAAATALGAKPVFPFARPYLPFLTWARRAEAVYPSPLGLTIHPTYGLWHAYRGALLFARPVDGLTPANRPMPCDGCSDKPCLTACPVGAFARGVDGAVDYAVDRCRDHVVSAAGADCRDSGCLARRACPVGRDFVYGPDQAAFHMDAFIGF